MWDKILYNNEKGSVLLVALIMLALLSLIGVAATRTTSTELQIAGNEKFQKIAFYTADAARGYVAMTPSLYGGDNIEVGQGLNFPNDADPSERFDLGNSQEFNGDVVYIGSFNAPRGSGFEAGKFHAHKYRMTCNGYGPSDSEKQIETGFYRIGF
jgi:hypothetical protein